MKLQMRGKYWQVIFYDAQGERQRKSTGCLEHEKALAQAKAVRIVQETLEETKGIDRTNKTLGDALKVAYPDTQADVRNVDKLNHDLKRRDWLIKNHGDVPLLTIDYSLLTSLVNEWKEAGNSPATINRKLAFISKAMKHACNNMRWIGNNDIPKFPRQRENNKKDLYYQPEEIEAIRRVIHEFHNEGAPAPMSWLNLEHYFMFVLDVGSRLNETRLIEWDDIQAPQSGVKRLVLHETNTKTNATRIVPLTDRALKILDELKSQGYPRPFSWVTSADALCCMFRKVRDAVGLGSGYTLHTLRHTCASRLVQAGMDLYLVKDWLGHSSIKTTERYAHLAPTSLDTGVALLKAFG